MTIKRYKLVFYADISDGHDIAQVKSNLAVLFKIAAPDVERLFTNIPVTIKADLTHEAAVNYKSVFEKTGGMCLIEPMEFAKNNTNDIMVNNGENYSVNLMSCPKCLFEQSQSKICIKCGIVIEKFLEQQEKFEQKTVDNITGDDEVYPESLGIKKNIFSINYLVANLKYVVVFLLVIGASVFWIANYYFSAEKRLSQATPPRVYPIWLKSFNKQNMVNSVNMTSDGGFIVAGRTAPLSVLHRQDAWIIKLDKGGNIQWQRGFTSKGLDDFNSIVQAKDGGYLAVGKITAVDEHSMPQSTQGFLVKISTQGTVQWQRTIPDVVYNSIDQASNGDVFLFGRSISSDNSALIAKLSSDGQYKWQKDYGKDKWSVVKQTSDGGCIVLGMPYDLVGVEALVMKIDSAGAVQWRQQYVGDLNAVEEMADGGFILAGSIKHISNEVVVNTIDDGHHRYRRVLGGTKTTQARLLRLDRNGVAQWHKRYSDSSFTFESLHKTKDGNLLASGNTVDFYPADKDLSIMSLKENGSINWQKTYKKPYQEISYYLQPTTDGGYLIKGTTISSNGHQIRSVIGKTDSSGELPGPKLQATNSLKSIIENAALPPHNSITASVHDVMPSYNGSQLLTFDPLLKIACLYPPEPKLEVTSATIYSGKIVRLNAPEPKFELISNASSLGQIGPVAKSDLIKDVMRLENLGGADLTIKKLKIKSIDNRSIIARMWALITLQPAPSFSINQDCTTIKPDNFCAFRVDMKSGIIGENNALLTIVSNDLD
ncbi:MAG: hypothetical protein FIA91_08415, partial [Geobacter sp.]|nr:hypothetical protein [Geobacter sp.]